MDLSCACPWQSSQFDQRAFGLGMGQVSWSLALHEQAECLHDRIWLAVLDLMNAGGIFYSPGHLVPYSVLQFEVRS